MNSLRIAKRLLPLTSLEAYQKIYWQLTRHKFSKFSARLAEWVSQRPTRTIIFPPSVDWNGQLFQRPQHMASALARHGCRVLYFQHREHWHPEPFIEILPGLLLCSVPMEAFWELTGESLYTYAMTWNCRSALAPNIRKIIYDVVDELSVFPGSQARLASDHSAMLNRAYLVLTTSNHLLDQAQRVRPDVLLCPNGVDYEHFSRARQTTLKPPDDLALLVASGKPIAGYIGALARWMDYVLLENVVKIRTDWQFVLIGPDHDQTLPHSLLELPNITWLGAKAYETLPAYLRYFSTALIPFQLNQITHAVSPLKLFEYMAAGKPVISTPIYEATQIESVLLANNVDEFSSCLDQAISKTHDAGYLTHSDQLARNNTWDERARRVVEALNQASGE